VRAALETASRYTQSFTTDDDNPTHDVIDPGCPTPAQMQADTELKRMLGCLHRLDDRQIRILRTRWSGLR
jgi:hypothetical protein